MKKTTVAIVFAVTIGVVLVISCFCPRGRITKESAERLIDGIAVDDASEIIGLHPGWYDGVTSVSFPQNYYKGYSGVEWVGLNGAIIANCNPWPSNDRRLSSIEFYSRADCPSSFDILQLVYDRTIQRLIDWQSPIATVAIVLLMFGISIAPATIAALVIDQHLLQVVIGSAVMLLATWSAIAWSLTDSFFVEHQSEDFEFFLRICPIPIFATSIFVLVVRIRRINLGLIDSSGTS